MPEKNEDEAFIRSDLGATSGGGVAYFRVGKGMKEFLNKLDEKHEIEAVILSREDGRYDWNIGFALKVKK